MEEGQEFKESDPAFTDLPWWSIPVALIAATGIALFLLYLVWL